MEKFSIEEIMNTEHILTGAVCKFCDSTEIRYDELENDSFCSDCGNWQKS